jgi:hypothetical protein
MVSWASYYTAVDVFQWSSIKDQRYQCPLPQSQMFNELRARIVAAVAIVKVGHFPRCARPPCRAFVKLKHARGQNIAVCFMYASIHF